MNEEDWETFKKSVVRLEKGGINPYPQNNKIKSISQKTEKVIDSQESLGQMETIGNYDKKTLDKNLLKKIKKGRIKINCVLDLHGQNLNDARTMVMNFINRNYEIENRLALVITGKGQRLAVSDGWKGTGVLKKNLPKWLNSLAISSKILWYGHAPQEKGGSGAMLVYLKKKITK